MLLTSSNVSHYMLAKRLIAPESIVDGAFEALDVSGRNRNFKILLDGTAGFFVKQIQHWDAQTAAMLQTEAACYWRARHDAAFTPLAPLTPELHWYDPERHIIITHLIPES